MRAAFVKRVVAGGQPAQLRQVPIVVFANKQDMEGAATGQKISEVLDLPLLGKDRCAIFETSAITGQGIPDGMKWLGNAIHQSYS